MAFVSNGDNIRQDDLGGFSKNLEPVIEELADKLEKEYLTESEIEEKFLSTEDSKKLYVSFSEIEDVFAQKVNVNDQVTELRAEIDKLKEQIKNLTPKT